MKKKIKKKFVAYVRHTCIRVGGIHEHTCVYNIHRYKITQVQYNVK